MSTAKAAIPLAPGSPALTSQDLRVIEQVNESLSGGLEVFRWWKRADAARSYREQYELERAFNPADRATAFFDEPELSWGKVPLLGCVQQMTFDYSRRDPQDAHAQIREFVLRYFLRVSDYRRPASFMLRELRRTKEQQAQLDGWGYSQVYYKLRDGGAVGKFPESAQSRIVDLREIGETYEWIIFQARLFNLAFDLNPLGGSFPRLVLPVAAFTNEYLITSRELMVVEVDPAPGVLGRYGYGCATLRDTELRAGPLLWGPGRFYPGFAALYFEVRSTGETVVTAPFAVNRPERILGLQPDPLAAGFRLADGASAGLLSKLFPDLKNGFDPVLGPIAALNTVTGNLPGDRFGISKKTLERFLLVEHFMGIYELLAGAALTYCRVPDWTAPEKDLPQWVQDGLVH
jgi:hypothetical protein